MHVDPALIDGGTKPRNTKITPAKVVLPSCDTQASLSKLFEKSNEKFYGLMEQGDGPSMQQNPFPRFQLSNCMADLTPPDLEDEKLATTSPGQVSSSQPDTTSRFLSFDLGGSGLKVMQLTIWDTKSSDGKVVKHAKPLGEEINLGRVLPGNYIDPNEWVKLALRDNHLSLEYDFGLSGPANTYKLFGRKEYEAIKELIRFDNLHVACEAISNDVPAWAEDTTVWCNKWIPADKVLGLSDGSSPGFQGSFSDGRAHFEAARSRLELMNFPQPKTMEPFVFVSWGLGTGQTIFWTRDRTKAGELVKFHPAINQTASTSPKIYSSRDLAPVLSTEPVYHIHEILVDIPESVRSKNTSLALDGYEQPLNEPLPFWMILDGSIWSNPSISRADVRQVYKNFFRSQVLGAIKRGELPKPSAMVFSGGQEDHFHIAGMLNGMLEKQGIQSVAGFEGGTHCGVVRLSYLNTHVDCQFDVH